MGRQNINSKLACEELLVNCKLVNYKLGEGTQMTDSTAEAGRLQKRDNKGHCSTPGEKPDPIHTAIIIQYLTLQLAHRK